MSTNPKGPAMKGSGIGIGELAERIAAAQDDISAYIKDRKQERQHLLDRVTQLDKEIAIAERDCNRVQSALACFYGDEEAGPQVHCAANEAVPADRIPRPYQPGEGR